MNTLSECVTLFSDQFLNIYNLTILSSFQVGFRTYAIKKPNIVTDNKVDNNQVKPNLMTRTKNTLDTKLSGTKKCI